jgi:DNA-binding LacI/PurR family transcriptional regulator
MSVQNEISRTRPEDVASELGVSHQTVSRVINNHPRVLPETRARVLRAIQRLGYRPNRAARFLANRRSSLFGLVTIGAGQYGPAHLILAVEHEAQNQGLTLMIHALRDFNVAAIQRAVSELLANSALGVLVDVPFELPKRELRDALANTPFVALDIDGKDFFSSCRVDHVAGARAMTRHLLELGHRQIAGIMGEERWRSAVLRRRGWLLELSRSSLQPGPCLESAWTADGGYEATKKLLDFSYGKFTVIFAANDLIALGALLALHERGIEVPKEISVVGFDGMARR